MSDKRNLRNGYKRSFIPMGVFVIRNTENQRVYVGGSRNLDGAMNRHRFELATGAHRNAELLADWKRFGAAVFRFEVLDQVRQKPDPDADYDAELSTLIALWQHELACFGPGGYNGPERPVATR